MRIDTRCGASASAAGAEDAGEWMPPRLFVEAIGFPAADLASGADAVICSPAAPETSATEVIWRLAPGKDPEGPTGDGAAAPRVRARVRVVEATLAGLRRLAEARLEARIVPRLEVRRAAPLFTFVRAAPGEGFSTYQPDPAAVAGYVARAAGEERALGEWLRAAGDLGFDEFWLHAPEAEAAGRGFAVEALRYARRRLPEGRFWLSGGGSELRHFRRLFGESGLTAVVVSPAELERFGIDALRAALGPPDQGTGGAPAA